MNKSASPCDRPALLRFWLSTGFLGGALAFALLPGTAAQALPLTITTIGTITAGSDPGDILGLGASLSGDSYRLAVTFNGLGAGYFTDGSGGFAQDFGDTIPGTITVTVNGQTLSTVIVSNAGPSLTEDSSDIVDSTSGNDAAGNFAYASQDVGSTTNFIPYADLQTAFAYTLAATDTGLDNYSFSNAANTETVSFSGTTSAVTLQLPEPASIAIMAVGLCGMGVVLRRSRA